MSDVVVSRGVVERHPMETFKKKVARAHPSGSLATSWLGEVGGWAAGAALGHVGKHWARVVEGKRHAVGAKNLAEPAEVQPMSIMI